MFGFLYVTFYLFLLVWCFLLWVAIAAHSERLWDRVGSAMTTWEEKAWSYVWR